MNQLAIVMIIILQMANCNWTQNGRWKQQTLSNTSSLFTYFGHEEGQATIKGSSGSEIINVYLYGKFKDNGIKRSIHFTIRLTTEQQQTDPVFMIQKSVKHSFARQQELFNITFAHRKFLELRCTEGAFLIKLIDVQQTSPLMFYYLWMILILIVMVFQAYFYLLKQWDKPQKVLPTLGCWSGQLIMWWICIYLWNFVLQSFYLPDTFGSKILAVCSCLIMAILVYEIIGLELTNAPKNHLICSSLVFASGFINFAMKQIFISTLWYYLIFVIAYELITIFYAKQEDTQRKILKIFLLMLIYMFPCFIFPFFSFEIRYPQEEAKMWWLYGIFYLVEVVLFLLKAKVFSKLKRLMKLKVQKQLNSQAYLDLQENACPLCLKGVETSEIGMSPAGEMPKVDWIQAECGHHFHKACVRQNMQEDCCFFDNIKWTQEFKNTAQK